METSGRPLSRLAVEPRKREITGSVDTVAPYFVAKGLSFSCRTAGAGRSPGPYIMDSLTRLLRGAIASDVDDLHECTCKINWRRCSFAKSSYVDKSNRIRVFLWRDPTSSLSSAKRASRRCELFWTAETGEALQICGRASPPLQASDHPGILSQAKTTMM